MKPSFTLLTLLLVCFAETALAQDSLPDGWTKSDDGAYSHPESGSTCPTIVEGFSLQNLIKPSEPNLLGNCIYIDMDSQRAEIRVRKFVRGYGETPLAKQNDILLVEKTGLPKGFIIPMAMRGGPGPEIDGEESIQSVETVWVHNLLVDCFVIEKRAAVLALSVEERSKRKSAFCKVLPEPELSP